MSAVIAHSSNSATAVNSIMKVLPERDSGTAELQWWCMVVVAGQRVKVSVGCLRTLCNPIIPSCQNTHTHTSIEAHAL